VNAPVQPDGGAADRPAATGPGGITVAARAEAMQVQAANEPSDHLGDVITTYAQALSGLGQIIAGAASEQADNPAEILVPPALLLDQVRPPRLRAEHRQAGPGRHGVGIEHNDDICQRVRHYDEPARQGTG